MLLSGALNAVNCTVISVILLAGEIAVNSHTVPKCLCRIHNYLMFAYWFLFDSDSSYSRQEFSQ